MPADTAYARETPPRAVSGAAAGNGRGRPLTVSMRTTTFVAVLTEGIALADEVMAGAERIHAAAAIGSRQQIGHEAGRLAYRAQAARAEFRRFAGGLDDE